MLNHTEIDILTRWHRHARLQHFDLRAQTTPVSRRSASS